ncbi:2-oxoacid:ferredoxin oxidoreductase, beta subunit [Candidatus Methanoperedens nitroreducens]|uniref:2-oxoacid:ferredoxin oxidoreductase, beta subunit n=1 Tax=Candidatus Methanoperedens nitratireducens TaxID=1392998 RepID=A0A062VD78_9EURY|nr:2-oxoacid:ferredoxin oxidoreductase subunit beta [Candidatus Methanoperedens nitroreducens]KCZ73210.1 2-oxoacid:ferredoxin oxidoreductase, beta subunit [Candidatus Methanoperedens nitroreducens]MDJ1422841.1 2-oxoacid:ferredoxin oxidoreductase subunit beta [Candidatus Methanoperedens sp.]
MMRTSETVYKYLRPNKKFPHVWCPGCGIGIVMGALVRAIDKKGLSKDDIVLVSGIGCSGRMSTYLDFNTLHTTHGRALAFAAGIKLARPELTVIVVMGDGDATAIGGNHLIHACRRNIDITALIINNNIYGMTGGQYSPTTPMDKKASTAQYGNIEKPFDICKLVEACGASFVARGTTYRANMLDPLIEKAISRRGFSVVEAMAQCPVQYGRRNIQGGPVDMLQWYRDHAVPVAAFKEIPPGEAGERFPIGVMVDLDEPGYIDRYKEIIKKAGGEV